MKSPTEIEISGHLQRLIRQGLTLAAGALVARGVIDQETAGTAVDSITTGTSAIVSAVVLYVIGYVWSSIRATKLFKNLGY